MAPSISRRTLTSILFITLFALSSADKLDSIMDKIAISPSELSTILRLSSAKQPPVSSTLFSILFPSSRPAINALLATAYISGPPNFILALCPPDIDPANLSIMVAFAVGGLLGDTFFHLLPEIFLGEDSEEGVRMVALEPNRNLLLGVWIFVGLATFMGMDKALRIATGAGHSHTHEGKREKMEQQAEDLDYRLTDDLRKVASNETQQEHDQRLSDKPYNDTMVDGVKTKDLVSSIAEANRTVRKRKNAKSDASEKSETSEKSERSVAQQVMEPLQESSEDADDTLLSNEPTKLREQNPSVKLAGLLNLIADFTHNITDGLALSTSFYSSPALGATTTMAVFFHEIPHEVGDFALLIQSGFTKRAAMGAQFVTAIGAFLGTIIGILVQEYGSGETGVEGVGLLGTSLQWSDVLLPFTAGTFLYVGTVGVIPELLENEPGKTRVEELKRTLMQFGAMAVGALIMVVISWN